METTVQNTGRKGIRLPAHTWYARGDDVVINFPAEYWKGVLNLRGTSPEEKGYWFCEESDNNSILALFNVIEGTGSTVNVTSNDVFLDAIKEFTRNPRIHVIGYHTHPIDGPSSGDIRSYINIYERSSGQLRDFLTIGPKKVELDRVYPSYHNPRVVDICNMDSYGNPKKGMVRLVRIRPEQEEGFKRKKIELGQEFHRILKQVLNRRPGGLLQDLL
jgi:hypothetical protein